MIYYKRDIENGTRKSWLDTSAVTSMYLEAYKDGGYRVVMAEHDAQIFSEFFSTEQEALDIVDQVLKVRGVKGKGNCMDSMASDLLKAVLDLSFSRGK